MVWFNLKTTRDSIPVNVVVGCVMVGCDVVQFEMLVVWSCCVIKTSVWTVELGLLELGVVPTRNMQESNLLSLKHLCNDLHDSVQFNYLSASPLRQIVQHSPSVTWRVNLVFVSKPTSSNPQTYVPLSAFWRLSMVTIKRCPVLFKSILPLWAVWFGSALIKACLHG